MTLAWPRSLASFVKERWAIFILFSASPQATEWAASHNQLWPVPLPHRSYDDHPSPLQSERDLSSEPTCSGRSQTKLSACQPGWVQSELKHQLVSGMHLPRGFVIKYGFYSNFNSNCFNCHLLREIRKWVLKLSCWLVRPKSVSR